MIPRIWAIMRQIRSCACLRKKKVTRKWHFSYLPRSPPWTDFYQTWNERSPRGRNQPWQILWQSVQGFKFYRRSKFHFFPIGIWRRRYNRAALFTVCLQWWKQTLEGGGAPPPQPTWSLGSFVSAPAAIAFLAYYIGHTHRTFPVEKNAIFFA